jgi:predicted dehydrogenase
MTLVRIGLVGLSTTSKSTNWAARAHLPFLQSDIGRKHFEIVALCNSSIASGEKSKEHYKLPASVKTYDSPEKLAQDPDVDLVVNVTDVGQHYGVLLPVAKAGKNVYTELPLAQTVPQMKELVAVAKDKKIKTVFGMQGQTSSVSTLLRKIIDEGRIGKVLSTSWNGVGMMFGAAPPVPVAFKKLLMREAGANFMTVIFLHSEYRPQVALSVLFN